MNARDLLSQLNKYPMWVTLDGSEACETISALGQLFRSSDAGQRQAIAAGLGNCAHFVMYEYTRDKAVEARRSGSRDAVIDGLTAVVMAGGRSDNITGGSLMTMLLRSAEKTGLDAGELFTYAATFAISEEQAAQLREFPSLPPEMRDIARAGIRERNTAEGVVYELPTEELSRPRWWDKLLRRRRLTREQSLDSLRWLDELNRRAEANPRETK